MIGWLGTSCERILWCIKPLRRISLLVRTCDLGGLQDVDASRDD